MTNHLRPEEFVDAIDGRLPAARREHLEACETCRADVSLMSETLDEAGGVPVSMPSPLFWDHFSERVREATAAEPARESAWRIWWRPAVAFAGVAGAVALAIVLRPAADPVQAPPPTDTVVESTPAAADALDADAEAAWSLVLALAAEFDEDDVRGAITPAPGAADAMIEDLTDAQRAQLAALLQQELGES